MSENHVLAADLGSAASHADQSGMAVRVWSVCQPFKVSS